MNMSIAKKVVDLLPSSQPETIDADTAESDHVPTTLYECEPCSTTYISRTMDDCPNCGSDVSEVPSEKELGML